MKWPLLVPLCLVVEAGTPVCGNDEVERNLVLVEKVAYHKGLPPEAVSVMLEFAMSLRMGTTLCPRVLKCMIPATMVPQKAVVRAVVWLSVGKIPISTQVLFLKWVLTMFDLIDGKEQLRAIYGFIFSFITDENLCPFICHLLYLLTRKENVRVYRVRKLLELQSKLGRQPFLLHLLSLYKVFCPELVTLSIPSRMRVCTRKLHQMHILPACYRMNQSSVCSLQSGFRNHSLPWKSTLIRMVKRNDSQVASSISLLPAQMGSLLGSSVALQYLDCVQDESALLRLNFWLGYALHEEFLFCDGVTHNSEESLQFLNKLLSTQHFLQEGFSSSEVFLYKFLNIWDGSFLRPQILGLLSNIPVVPSSQIGQLLFQPLMQLFFTSSIFFKVGFPDRNMTLSGFKDSVIELIHFVGRLASVGLQLEGCHTLLLSFVLDFYETVCDTFLKYGLPLVVMPPAGVFYPALLATDPVSVDRLAYIMYRYKVNLTSAKSQGTVAEAFHISRQTFREFNHYIIIMVNCLWNSRMFQTSNLDMKLELRRQKLDVKSDCAFQDPKSWNWYLEYLFTQGWDGLQQFVQSNVSWKTAAEVRCPDVPSSQES
uniref:Centromere protein I n=1 Tax=Takifugu rubripes TaxID=31033 RepID=A0A674PKI4_TAKRU